MPSKWSQKTIYIYFIAKNLDILFESSAMQITDMKCQALITEKKIKLSFAAVVVGALRVRKLLLVQLQGRDKLPIINPEI